MEWLPQKPGPLYCLGSGPWFEALDLDGFEIIQAALNPQDADAPERFPCIYAAADQLGEYPLNALGSLSRAALRNGSLIVECNGPGQAGNAWAAKAKYLTAIAATQGWDLAEGALDASHPPLLLKYRKRVSTGRYSLSMLEPSAYDSVLDLFERAFGYRVSPESWLWKYGEGRGVAVVASRSGRMVAHYGGMIRRVWMNGAEQLALQICDVMVDPDERGAFMKSGAFSLTARTFLEATLGYGDRYSIAYGFPTERAFRLGCRLGLYREVDHLNELRWSPLQARRQWRYETREIADIRGHEKDIERLWRLMAAGLSGKLALVRDARYLQDRYLRHPRLSYSLFGLKDRYTRRLVGLVVIRKEGKECQLVDVLAPLSNLPLLVELARCVAAAMGADALVTWITASQMEFLNTAHPEITKTPIRIPGDSHVQRTPIGAVDGSWWLMMGDTDFL